MSAKPNSSTGGLCKFAWASLGLVLLSGIAPCSWGSENVGGAGGPKRAVELQQRNWRVFIDECVSRVEKSEAVFYRRGEQVTGRELARQMRAYLETVLRAKSVPDPFGRNAGILLAMITTHEGIAMDGLTGPPQPCEVEVGGRRMKVYDWLKQEFGVNNLPGEQEGHEVFETLYETELKPELLAQWERYIDRCIEVVRGAKGSTFSIAGKAWPPAEVAAMMEGNRSNVVRELKSPAIRNRDDKERYSAGRVLVMLTSMPVPRRESFPDQAQYTKAVDAWATQLSSVTDSDGRRHLLTGWVESKAGRPPPVPKLKKRH